VELRIGGRPGPTFALAPDADNVLGRATDAVVALPDRLASRSHASIRRDTVDGRWLLRDLGSRNGTWLDGTRVTSGVLENGSVIRLGTSELVFRFEAVGVEEGGGTERLVRCGPVGQFAGRALRHPASGQAEDSRWPLLLYQAGIRLLVSRSLREVIGTTLELAAEHCGATAYGWFRPARPGRGRPTSRLEPVCIVPPGSELFDQVGDATVRMILDERKAVWIAAGGAKGEGGMAGAGDMMCVPLVDHDEVIAMLAAAGPAGTLRDADFDFLVALASLAAAASAGREGGPTGAAGGPPVDGSDDSSLREAISLLATIPVDSLRDLGDGDDVPGGGTLVLDAAAAAALDPRPGAAARISALVAETATLRLDEWHRVLVIEALRRSGGSVPNAAAELGISRATLYRKLESYGLARSRG